MPMHQHSLKFRTLAAASGWNEPSLLTAFRQGLNSRLRLHLATYDDTYGLEKFIQLAIRCSNRLQSCSAESSVAIATPPIRQPEISDPPEPMQTATTAYRLRRDKLQIGQLHQEELHLLVLEGSSVDIILGRPWLVQHDPHLSWRTEEVLKWVKSCFPHCFPRLTRPLTTVPIQLPVHSTFVESPVEKQSVNIPSSNSHFSDVFCPKRAAQLPPHRPWDCAIDLFPGEPVPHGKIYPLSLPEQKAMEVYIEEALRQGYIVPSTSPAASSFFFVAKKDGGLRPCIDYRKLNEITVKFRYPLPLVPTALEQLRGAIIFTKLDLRSAYKLIRISEGDEWKMAFVTPTGHYWRFSTAWYGTVRYGTVHFWGVFHWVLYLVPDTFLVPLRSRFHASRYRYQNVTCKLCCSLNGRRKSSLLRH